MSDTKFYVDTNGAYLGGFNTGTGQVPSGAIAVPTAPSNALDIWNFTNSAWDVSDSGKAYAIYECLDLIPSHMSNTTPPFDIDYIRTPSSRLHPKEVFVFGELQEVIYYRDQILNEDGKTFTYSVPVVKETYVYTRDGDGLALSRVGTIAWYYTDGTLDEVNTKTRIKIYADKPIAILREIVKRRDNNVKNIIGTLIPLIMATDPSYTQHDVLVDGKLFFKLYNDQRVSYIHDGTTDLEESTRDSSDFSWLSNDISTFTPYTTIRNYIIHELSMGLRSS